jgi:zinc transport system substrate-binding protein
MCYGRPVFSRIVLVIVGLAAVLTAGCGGSAHDPAETQVIAAFYPLAYAAEQVAGDSVSVRNLTPAGSEPHDFELSAGDVRATEDADLVVYAGGGFQPAVEQALANREGPSLDVLDGQRPTGAGGEMREIDPHTWLDPKRYADQARSIARALGGGASADQLAARLDRLDRDFEQGLASCARREIVTSHAAFGYLAKRYGLRQTPLTGIAPEAEPTPRDLERLVRQVEVSGATTVFHESLVSPKLAETVAREAGVATAVLNPVEGLTEEQRAEGADYFTLMRANLVTLRKALGCR